ncbi:MAG: agmatine deiminase family protein [Deltaproteobacteria bacterium]|nr:agmatine deiminase family protein [Deltaproteobacteria bacterium]
MTHLLISFYALLSMTSAAPYNPSASNRIMLPKWKTPAELQKDSSSQLNQYRMDHPELYGITVPPPAGFGLYSEFSTVDAMYISYDDYFQDYYVDVIREAAEVVDVYVLVSGDDWLSGAQTVLESEIGSTTMQNVHFVDLADTEHYVYTTPYYDSGLDSIWVVDFGPYYLINASNEVVINDPHYYPDRINDDSVPSKLGDMDSMNVYRPDIYLEGGNLLADGIGGCYTTEAFLDENYEKTTDELNEILLDYFGCVNVTYLQPLSGEGTGHIDMFFILANPTTVLVGDFTTTQDSANKAVMDENAALLGSMTNSNGDEINVIRIPMPDPTSDSYGRIWRTYTNGLRLNSKYLMPVYSDDTAVEAEAEAAIQGALSGVEIVGITSDEVITWGGAIHCTTRSRPAGTAYSTAEDPDYLCEGAYVCDGCTNDCSLGDTGCNEDGSRWICGQNDSDICMDKITIDCPENMDCVDGTCGGEDCTDDCVIGEYGCDGDSRWVCSEEGDGDSCMDAINIECDTDRECQGGICIPPDGGCGDISYDGECQGNVSIYCDEDYLVAYDCAEDGMECGYVSNQGWYDCVAVTACEDECVPGESMCGESGDTVLRCAETFDGDSCFEYKEIQCDDGMFCVDGECQTECTDECAEGTIGCSDDASGSWVCTMGTDGCYEMVVTACSEGTCTNGECVTDDGGSNDDGCSCSNAGSSKTSGGIFFMMVLLGVAVLTRRQII